ncbi:MAG: carbohydrate kinase [Clostridiales bacterium]|nr:carbohydrate kinase [Clostridiales bacterium]
MFDVAAIGEILIDFTPNGISNTGNILLERNPGGAPANVLAALSKLGSKTAFIGKVGDDQFGKFLEKTLIENRIDTRGLRFSNQVPTTLAFVHLSPDGERSFSFYRNPGADMMLEAKEIQEEIIKESNILHFGSISLTDEPARSATFEAIRIAKENGLIISYDPNLRPLLWKSMNHAKKEIKGCLKYADILKISEEELEFITDESDLKKGTNILEQLGISLIFVTRGPKGTYYRYAGKTGSINTYDIKVVDTTGAGDAFLGAALYKLKDLKLSSLKSLTIEKVEEIIDFANAAGALTTTGKGAIPSVPSMSEIIDCIRNVPRLLLE